jgi:Uma2 family endonuclease
MGDPVGLDVIRRRVIITRQAIETRRRSGYMTERQASARTITADELIAMPHDGLWHELVRGELRTMTPSGSRHGIITGRVTTILGGHVEANALGEVLGAETGFKLASDPDTVRAPDVAFIRRERVPPEGAPEGFWPGAPDLAVEVLSPSDTSYEVEERVDQWLRAGARAVWVLNPRRRTVTIHRPGKQPLALAEDDTLHGGEAVPQFSCVVATLFSRT